MDLFWLMVSAVSVHGWPQCFQPVVRQTSWWKACGGTKLLTSWQQGNRERRGPEQEGHFKDTHPVTYFFQPGPTSSFPQPPVTHQIMTPSKDWSVGELRALVTLSLPKAPSAGNEVLFNTGDFGGISYLARAPNPQTSKPNHLPKAPIQIPSH
jgi:hypothetical protein